MPFADGSFDVVTCFEVIEHLERPQELLAECRRVAGEDGVVVISTPNRLMTVEQSAFHVREYAPNELDELLDALLAPVGLDYQRDQQRLRVFPRRPDG